MKSRAIALALVGLGVAGCAAAPEGVKNMLPESLTKDPQPVIAEVAPVGDKDRERFAKAEDDLFNRRVAEYLVSYRPGEAYLNELLDRVRKASPVPDMPAHVYLTYRGSLAADSTEANNIYVSLGWLESAESEEELLVLLAHEFGHLALRHHESEGFFNAQKRLKIISTYAMSVSNKVDSVDKLSVDNKKAVLIQELLVQLMDALIHPMWKRQQEVAADKFARDILAKLNVPSRSQVAFFDRLADDEEKVVQQKASSPPKSTTWEIKDLLMSAVDEMKAYQHPKVEDRISEVDAYGEQFYPKSRKDGQPAKRQEGAGLKALRKTGHYAAVMRNYRAAREAEKATDEGRPAEALNRARQAVRGPTEHHVYPLTELLRALVRERPHLKTAAQLNRNRKDIDDTVNRLNRTEEKSWKPFEFYLNEGDMTQARREQVLESTAQYFRGTPLVQVHRVKYYSKWGNIKAAEQIAGECALKTPEYTSLCQGAIQRPPVKS